MKQKIVVKLVFEVEEELFESLTEHSTQSAEALMGHYPDFGQKEVLVDFIDNENGNDQMDVVQP